MKHTTEWRESANRRGHVVLSGVSTERHREGQGTVDIGMIYQLTSNISLDTGVNLGINKVSPTLEWILGISVRY